MPRVATGVGATEVAREAPSPKPLSICNSSCGSTKTGRRSEGVARARASDSHGERSTTAPTRRRARRGPGRLHARKPGEGCHAHPRACGRRQWPAESAPRAPSARSGEVAEKQLSPSRSDSHGERSTAPTRRRARRGPGRLHARKPGEGCLKVATHAHPLPRPTLPPLPCACHASQGAARSFSRV